MKATIKTGLTITATLAAAMLSSATFANENPFSANSLESGYQLAQADSKSSEGKCGEGKCGAKDDSKKAEGKCGEGKCGAKDDSKKAEGKCGEGKCGAKDDSKKSEGQEMGKSVMHGQAAVLSIPSL